MSFAKFILTEIGCIHVLKEEGKKFSSVYGGYVGLGVECFVQVSVAVGFQEAKRPLLSMGLGIHRRVKYLCASLSIA